MNNLKLHLLALSLFGLFSAGAQTVFQKVYAPTSGLSGTAIVQTADKGYLSLGDQDFYLSKVDSLGTLKGIKHYPMGAANIGWHALVPSADGGILLVGTGVVKVDANQAVLWSKQYIFKNKHAQLINGLQTADGGYILCCALDSGITLLKTTSLGSITWAKYYSPSGSKDFPLSIIQTSDHGYAVCGTQGSFGAGHNDAFILKTDSTGKAQWSSAYGHTDTDEFASIAGTSDGGYILAGYTRTLSGTPSYDYHTLVKTNASGVQQWVKGIKLVDSSDMPCRAMQIAGGYILGGSTDNEGKSGKGTVSYLMKADNNGNFKWAKNYGGDAVHTFQHSKDGGYILVGRKKFAGNGLFVTKTDSNGFNGCPPPAFTPAIIVDTLTTSPIPYVAVSASVLDSSVNVVASSISTTDSVICNHLVTGITANAPLATSSVYPNPGNGLFAFETDQFENSVLEGYNSLGQKVFSEKLFGAITQFDLGPMANGLYYLRLVNKDSVYYQGKLTKAN
jgi:hypothetical protein